MAWEDLAPPQHVVDQNPAARANKLHGHLHIISCSRLICIDPDQIIRSFQFAEDFMGFANMPGNLFTDSRFFPELVLNGAEFIIRFNGVNVSVGLQSRGKAYGGIPSVSSQLQHPFWMHHATPILQEFSLDWVTKHLRSEYGLPGPFSQFSQDAIFRRAVLNRIAQQFVIQLMYVFQVVGFPQISGSTTRNAMGD